jgi:pilus assembly protein Flp/PilA
MSAWSPRPQNPGDLVCRSVDQQRHSFLEIPMLSIFRRLMKNEHGATAIEYTLIASLIAVAAIVAMKNVGGTVSNVLNGVATNMAGS